MNVVVVGGGTGSFTVLKGLKGKVDQLSAVVSMFDNGGSTGTLRDKFGMLPPGDVRRCLVALAKEDDMLRKLFMFRFDERLKGHSFGNLFLTALTEITKSEAEAIRQAETILRVQGRVLPVSFDDAQLCAQLEDNTIVKGETHIDVPKNDPTLRITKVWLEPKASANKEAVQAIHEADLVVIGPGDLFTSVIPNLLVEGISDAIAKSKATKVYVCNLMTKPGETSGFSAKDHVKELIRYGVRPDVLLGNNTEGPKELLETYAAQGQFRVAINEEELNALGVSVCTADLIASPDLIRHDSDKLAKVLCSLEQKKH